MSVFQEHDEHQNESQSKSAFITKFKRTRGRLSDVNYSKRMKNWFYSFIRLLTFKEVSVYNRNYSTVRQIEKEKKW